MGHVITLKTVTDPLIPILGMNDNTTNVESPKISTSEFHGAVRMMNTAVSCACAPAPAPTKVRDKRSRSLSRIPCPTIIMDTLLPSSGLRIGQKRCHPVDWTVAVGSLYTALYKASLVCNLHFQHRVRLSNDIFLLSPDTIEHLGRAGYSHSICTNIYLGTQSVICY